MRERPVCRELSKGMWEEPEERIAKSAEERHFTPRAPPAPSPRETAPASSSARTSRTPSAPPEFVVALALSPRLTPYTLSLWIGGFFRGSLGVPANQTTIKTYSAYCLVAGEDRT